MPGPVKIHDVRIAELDDIVQRREKIGLSSEDVENNLVGLCLSGGSQRSASFCLGLTQALQRLGLWKFVDYMSTVSGGGYIGSYLTSSTLKSKEPVSKENQPLLSDSGSPGLSDEDSFKQPSRVQRFIYGGKYLWKPWKFVNHYLVGVVCINVAIFSGLLAVCALIAFLWRCLDYPVIRDVGTTMFSLGDDLWAPFWPFGVFALAWLVAWGVSSFRRGSDARGTVARYLLVVCLASLFIGCALLVGNGDVAGLDKFLRGENIDSIGGKYWGPIVALVIGGLLPFLRPSRLLQSGISPQKPWERYVFLMASTALLVGLPLLLIGLLAHENISGYNDNDYRPLIKTDIGNWPMLCELTLEAVPDPEVKEAAFELSNLVFAGGIPLATNVASKPAASSASQLANLGPSEEDFYIAWRTPRDKRTPQAEEAADRFLSALAKPRKTRPDYEKNMRNDDEQKYVDEHLESFLKAKAWQLCRSEAEIGEDRVSLGEIGELGRLAHSQRMALGGGEWQRYPIRRYLWRCFSIVEATYQQEGEVQEYWQAKKEVEATKSEVCLALNELLASRRHLAQRLVTDTRLVQKFGKMPADANQPYAAQIANIENWQPQEVAKSNRLLLEKCFPDIFRGRDQIRRLVTIYEDQICRLKWFFGGVVVFLLAGMWVDLNSLSLHRYYRDRLAQAFIVPSNPKSPSVPLSAMITTQYGGPYHLLTGSVSMIRKRLLGGADDNPALRDSNEEVDQRWVDNFLFSRRYCGSELTGYIDTASYELSVPGYSHRIDLAEATAISGGAISSQNVDNWLLSFLMVAMNLGLGQYVPNPSVGKPRFRPRVLTILHSLWKDAKDRPYCFVSDGGHCENLGLVQLLKRRCKLIIVADVSCDPEHHFHDLGRAMRLARVHGGVKFVDLQCDKHGEDREFRTEDLQLRESDADGVKKGNCKKHILLARIKYPRTEHHPEAAEGLLVYLKPSFDGDESRDLHQFRHQHKEFPHDSTTEQLFSWEQVEAYRELGYHIGMDLNNLLPPELRIGELWDYGARIGADQLCEWFKNAETIRSPKRSCPIVKSPANASAETLKAIRPTYERLLQQMQGPAEKTMDDQSKSDRFANIVALDQDLRDLGMLPAIAAIQCAIVDEEQRPELRTYSVTLLESLELDEKLLTNRTESLEVLLKVAAAVNSPPALRLEAIAALAILGRGSNERERVKAALGEIRDDPESKPNIRSAVKKALSNFEHSPRKPR